jgi:hypothetical protein
LTSETTTTALHDVTFSINEKNSNSKLNNDSSFNSQKEQYLLELSNKSINKWSNHQITNNNNNDISSFKEDNNRRILTKEPEISTYPPTSIENFSYLNQKHLQQKTVTNNGVKNQKSSTRKKSQSEQSIFERERSAHRVRNPDDDNLQKENTTLSIFNYERPFKDENMLVSRSTVQTPHTYLDLKDIDDDDDHTLNTNDNQLRLAKENSIKNMNIEFKKKKQT